MTASPNPVEWSARHGVDLIKAVANRRIVMSVIGLAVITVIALAYITLGSLGVNPVSRKMSVRVSLRESGGLLVNQDVTLRGIPIGRVTAINLTEHGVEAVVSSTAPPESRGIPGCGYRACRPQVSNTWTSAPNTVADRI